MKAAEIFKALSDETRLRIVNLLARAGSMSVSDIVTALRMPQWHISRHLTRLRLAGLVEAQRKGASVHYRLADTVSSKVQKLLGSVHDLLDANAIAADLERLKQVMRRRTKNSAEA